MTPSASYSIRGFAPELLALLLGALILAAPAAHAQEAPTCDALLAEADGLYVERDFTGAEARIRACLRTPGLTDEVALRAFRLLALVFLRQDDLPEARQAVVRLLGVSFAYEPDPIQDPPAYVALVASVKEQLGVDAVAADTIQAAPDVTEPGILIVDRAPPDEEVAARPPVQRERGIGRWLLLGGGAVAAGLVAVLLTSGGGDSGGPPLTEPLPLPPTLPPR